MKWCNTYSIPYHIKSGIRQGGVLSPVLFNLYIDDIINALVRSDLGCLVFADDIIYTLLSASLLKLQKMLDICLNVVIILTLYCKKVNTVCSSYGF